MSIVRPSRNQLLLLLLALAAFSVNVVLLYAVTDDAYISFRYLDNWLSGHGLVFNAGERVEGYTNLLWILLIAPWHAMGLPQELVALVLSLLAAGALFFGVYVLVARLTRDTSAGCAAVLLTASFPPLAHYTGAGLETVLFASLIVLAFARISVAGRPDAWVAATLGAAVLTRPEGMMAALVVYSIYGWQGKSFASDRQVWRSALIFLLFPVILTSWRLWYYGDPLPNTFYAKATGSGFELIGNGLAYLGHFLMVQYGWVLLVFAMLALVPPALKKLHDQKLAWALGIVLLFHFLYLIKIGGDYLPMARFILHVFPLLAVLSALGLWFACRGRVRVVLALALGMAIVQNVAFYRSADYQVVEEIRLLNAEWKSLASWLKKNYPADTSIAVNAAGAIPYLTGFKTIDMLGLNDKHIARANASFRMTAGPVPGHFKYDGKYVCALQPDIVIMSSGRSLVASSAGEAEIVAALNSFDSDRDFLRACEDRYQPSVWQLENGRYRVLFTRKGVAPAHGELAVGSSRKNNAFQRGLELMARARLPEARQSFIESIRVNPGNPDSYTNIGYTYFDEDRLPDAVSSFEDTLRRFPGHPPAVYGLALATEKLGDRQRAIQLWRQYLESPAADSRWKARAADRLRLLEAGR